MEQRRAQLRALADALAALCTLLALDAGCPWRAHFQRCLREATALGAGAFGTAELNALGGIVMSVYGGMGSFNDYVPFHGGRLIAGMADVDQLSGTVYDCALQLRLSTSQLADDRLG